MIKIFLLMLTATTFVMIFASPSIAQAAVAINDQRATADYWTKKNSSGDNVFATAADLEMINLQIRQKSSGAIVDLAKYPEKVYKQWTENKITATMTLGGYQKAEVPALFKNGTALTEFSYTQAKKNCGLDELPAACEVRYALTTGRANLRLLPEEAGWFEEATDTHYDDLQATAIDPSEPLIVLVDSLDKQFVFVESRTYAGWIKTSALVFTDRATWLKYVAPQNYLTVIASRKTIPHGKAYFQMGSKVLLRAADLQKDGSWAICLPAADANGTVVEQGLNTPNDNGVVKGVLPCTENNIIRQAFRFLGEEYGWGGLDNSVDCSAFVQDVYRSVGIEIPRDTKKQEKSMPRSISLNGMNREQRLEILRKTKPGSLLFVPGHVMIYLGTDDKNEPIVIHSLSSYFTFEDGKTVKHYVRKILVSDLHFTNRNNVEMIDRITSIGNF